MEGTDGSKSKEEAMNGGDSSKQAIRWESILPRKSLRVLLVESDDATRHIVTALLRKCNYRVAAVADGRKAWEVMKEKKYIFDLVLTEVAMPTLSGIGLLTKIMGAEEYKNIPVIMMSSHDSVNVVLSCMLKGAVDFLVKPVRKNELRNLWQHVWRRHCVSNSSLNASDNTTASNQISVNVGDRSKRDESSDAQSSGNKQDANNENMQNPDQPSQSEGRHMDKVEVSRLSDKDLILEKSASKMTNDRSVANVREQSHSHDISHRREADIDLMREIDGTYDPRLCKENNSPNPDSSVPKMIVFVEPKSDSQCTFSVLKNDTLEGAYFETANSSFTNEGSTMVTTPVLELSLKRPQSNGCGQIEIKERNIIKPSVASAFSRYDDKRAQPSTVQVETLNTSKKNTSITYTDKRSSAQGNGIETTIYFQVSSTNSEKASLPPQTIRNTDTNHIQYPQFGFLPIPFGPLPYHNLCQGYGSLMQPMFLTEQSPSKYAIDKSESRDPRELCYINEKTYNKYGSYNHDYVKFNGIDDSKRTEDETRNIGVSIDGANESAVQTLDRSRREAALLKFRLKRKDRCFEKKVRYHSRKQLAEQRPRVKGQFVSQKVTKTSPTGEANS